jgi:cellulose synthase operon protein C
LNCRIFTFVDALCQSSISVWAGSGGLLKKLKEVRFLFGALFYFLIANSLSAEPPVRFAVSWNERARSLLNLAEGQSADEESLKAIPLYSEALEKYLYELVPAKRDGDFTAPGGFTLFQTTATYFRKRFHSLPLKLQKAYEDRVQSEAAWKFKEAAERREIAALTTLGRRYFGSRTGLEALALAGDLSFQEGKFSQAASLYQDLLHCLPSGKLVATHSHPALPLPLMEAHRVFASTIASGGGVDPKLIGSLEQQFPEAEFQFASRKGPLWKNLVEALTQDKWFSDAAASHVLTQAPWQGQSGGFKFDDAKILRTVSLAESLENGFPIPPTPCVSVTGRQLWLTTASKTTLYDLDELEACRGENGQICTAAQMVLPLPGSKSEESPVPVPPVFIGDRLLFSSPTSIGTSLRRRLDQTLWLRNQNEIVVGSKDGGTRWQGGYFEGPPTTDGSLTFISLVKSSLVEDKQIGDSSFELSHFLVALEGTTGVQMWARFLGNRQVGKDESLARLRALTHSRGSLYYWDGAGTLSVVEAATGLPRWTALLPQSERVESSLEASLDNRLFIEDGMVIGLNQGHVFALDSDFGDLLWRTPLEQPKQVLGISQGKVFVTGDRVWAIEAKSGKVLGQWPQAPERWITQGRGALLASTPQGEVIWPTNKGLIRIDQKTLQPIGEPWYPKKFSQGTAGNVFVSEKTLTIAFPGEVIVHLLDSEN